MLGGYLINGPLRSLRNAVYKDRDVLKRFASILLKSEDTVSLAQNILNDYSRFNGITNCGDSKFLDQTFLTQATPPSSSTTTSGNVWDCKLF